MESKFTLLFLLAAFCFSCSSFPGIEKRRYRDGFYVSKHHRENKLSAACSDSVSQNVLPDIKTEAKIQITFSEDQIISAVDANVEERKNVSIRKKNALVQTKFLRDISPKPIEVPKEPFNKKAKTAVVFYVLAKIAVITTFIFSLFSLLSTVFIIAGIAVLFALLAILFGILAKKELAKQLPYEKELGEKEANEVVQRAMAGIVSAVFMVLLALLIEWLKREF